MIYDKSVTACLTGHRPNKLHWGYNETKDSCITFKKELRNLLENFINDGFTNFLSGMAEGFDMIATEILLNLKNTYKDIKIIAVVPCLEQEKNWTPSQQNKYHNIIKKSDEYIILSNEYTPTCMMERNKFMVEHSSVVIGCFNGCRGGTYNTLLYAKKTGCKIITINPNTFIK